MPRQIIDTESSRPRYIRRLVLTWVLVAIVVGILVIVAFAAYGRYSHPASHALAVPPSVAVLLNSPGRSPGK